MVLALIASYSSLFIIKKPDGTPIKTLDNLTPEFDFAGLRETAMNIFTKQNSTLPTLTSNSTEPVANMDIQISSQEIYRWQDEKGNWHYSNSPPAGIRAETMDLQAPNVMTLYRESQNDSEGEDNTLQNAESESSGIPAQLIQMQERVQQAEEVSKQFQQKLDEQQQILQEL